jgi:hypothetical protein
MLSDTILLSDNKLSYYMLSGNIMLSADNMLSTEHVIDNVMLSADNMLSVILCYQFMTYYQLLT